MYYLLYIKKFNLIIIMTKNFFFLTDREYSYIYLYYKNKNE